MTSLILSCLVLSLLSRETASAVTQIEIDLKISLEEADQKRTVAEGIAEVVSKEKAIVEVETAKAQIQAKEVSIIQAEVGEKQRSTEADLAKVGNHQPIATINLPFC